MVIGATILVCVILICCNVFYTTDETEEKIEGIESELKKLHKM
jgi:hypothetical protein